MNRDGAAGRHGVSAETVVAFLDHYRTERIGSGVPLLNGRRISPSDQRAIRRWRNGHVKSVSRLTLDRVLTRYDFDWRWFDGWCKLHRKGG